LPSWWAVRAEQFLATEASVARQAEERRHQGDLLRDLVGNPFQPVRVDPLWLAWDGGTIPRLARAICAENAFDQLPIVADALEEAGCTQAALLDHLRGPGAHGCGCWAVDALTGRW
jgi:hypothetical protein